VTLEFGPLRVEITRLAEIEKRTYDGDGQSQGWADFIIGGNFDWLMIRAAEPGDRIEPVGMGGHTKKLSDVFTDKKIPKEIRWNLPVVVAYPGNILLSVPSIGLISEMARPGETEGMAVRVRVQPSRG
jgi:tRNA(Ile)-lysidine synthetase-like protein